MLHTTHVSYIVDDIDGDVLGPILLTCFKFNPGMDKKITSLQSVWWKYLSIPKLQRCKFGMDK